VGASCSAFPLQNGTREGKLQIRERNTSQLLCFSIQGNANIHIVVYRLPRTQPGNRGSIERRPVGEVLVVEDQGFTQQRPQIKLGHLEGHAFRGLLISTIGHCCPKKRIYDLIKNQSNNNNNNKTTEHYH
jgi:hypothetical protein